MASFAHVSPTHSLEAHSLETRSLEAVPVRVHSLLSNLIKVAYYLG